MEYSAAMLAMPGIRRHKIVEKEQFNPGDVSVAAQIERIKQANPQALIAWSTGAPIATVFKAAIQDGLDVPTLTTNGNQTNAEMHQFADFLPKQLYIASSMFPRHQGVYTLDPKVEAEQKTFYAAMDAAKLPVDNMAALAWDPGRILVELLRRLGPKPPPRNCAPRWPTRHPITPASTASTTSRNTATRAGYRGSGDVGWNAPGRPWAPLSLPAGKRSAH